MSDEMIQSLAKWGVPAVLWRKTRRIRNQTIPAPFGIDRPDTCSLGTKYWHDYPVKDFDYSFNSWGFRDCDFDQYRKENTNQKVNVCIGDSFTLNLGGPQEHSWPHLLGKYFDQPTLNISIDGMSAYYYQAAVDKCKQSVNVDRVFVLYNLFDDSQLLANTSQRLTTPAENVDQKLTFLKKHCWVHDAYWQFIPPWAFVDSELKYLYQHLPDAHNFLENTKIRYQDVDLKVLLAIEPLRQKYAEFAGPDWITYEKFCELCLVGTNIFQFFDSELDRRLLQEFLTDHFNMTVKKILLTNRDTVHMNQQVNQKLADYFYQQSCLVKIK